MSSPIEENALRGAGETAALLSRDGFRYATPARVGNAAPTQHQSDLYQGQGGRPERRGFLACSCWVACCLTMQSRKEEARAPFERVLTVANDLSLLSEAFDVPAKHLAGNLRQALMHLAVVNIALGLGGPTLQLGGG